MRFKIGETLVFFFFRREQDRELRFSIGQKRNVDATKIHET